MHVSGTTENFEKGKMKTIHETEIQPCDLSPVLYIMKVLYAMTEEISGEESQKHIQCAPRRLDDLFSLNLPI